MFFQFLKWTHQIQRFNVFNAFFYVRTPITLQVFIETLRKKKFKKAYRVRNIFQFLFCKLGKMDPFTVFPL